MLDAISQALTRENVSQTACADENRSVMSHPVIEVQVERHFTETDKNRIRELCLKRSNISLMASELNRPKWEIKVLLGDLGLGSRGGTWSTLHDQRLKELSALNVPVAQIAVEMDFTAETIRKHCRALGLPYNHGPNPRKFWTDDRVEEVRRLAARGLDDGAIAKHFKKRTKQIVLVRNEHRIRLNRDVALNAWREKVCVLSPKKEKQLRSMAAAGEDDESISRALKLSVKKVKRRRRNLKIRTQKGRPWSVDEIAVLCRLWPTSAGLPTICAEIKHTPYFVSKKANELNLPMRSNVRRQKQENSNEHFQQDSST